MTQRLLEARIASLRGQLRRLLAVHGICRIMAAIIPLVILAGFIDWLFHLERSVRAGLLVLLIGGSLWMVYRFVLRPLWVRFADLDLALRIEQRWPGLNDRLASTVQFLRLHSDDERYGSPALRQATVEQALEETRQLDFRELIDRRPIRQAAALAGGAVVLATLIASVAPDSSQIALRRLFLPYAGDRWPQQTHLLLIPEGTTLKLARGDSFTVVVGVRPGDRVPPAARIWYRFADGEETVESLRIVEGGEFRGRLETVNQPFRFSVTGGDDSTSIRDVEVRVVPPPVLNRLVIRLVAPPYSGLPVETLAQGLTSFRALKGTRVELEGTLNKPLRYASLVRGESSEPLPAVLNSARTGFRADLTVEENTTFWFTMEDTEGFRNREIVRHDVRVLKDEAPRVVIAEPKTDRDLPAEATIPLRIELDDDYGLHSARLIYKVSSGQSEPLEAVAIPLWSAPEVESQPGPTSFVKHQELAHEWNLEPLKLPNGSIITYYADARDFDSIGGPNLGKSRELRIRIVSQEEAARQFDDARRELREEIARILAMQRQATTPVEEAIRALEQSGRLTRPQQENLDNSGLIQRQVGSRLSNREEGLERKIRRLLDDIRNLKLANPEAQEQMEQMLGQLDTIRDRHLGPAEQGLSRASKGLDQIRELESKPSPIKPQPSGSEKPTDNPETPAAAEADTTSNQTSPPRQGVETNPQRDERKPQASSPQTSPSPKDASNPPTTDQVEPTSPKKPSAPTQEPSESALANVQHSLAEAALNQQAISKELQKMLDGLSEFETYRGVVKDAQGLLKQQEEAMKQVAEAAVKPELMGKSMEALAPEQKGELGNLAARQTELAKGLQNLQERMEELARRLEESDPLAAAAMREAATESRNQGTQGKMAEAADRIEKNQLSQARSQQDLARKELKDLVDAIQNRRERELARLVKEMKQAEAELRQLRDRQSQNLKATREAQKLPNPQERQARLKRLAKEQALIQQELKRQLQRLAKLNAERANQAGQDAAGRMAQAEAQLDQDEGEEAGKNQEEALADLEEAQEELAQNRREAEERLAMEQLARMGDQFKSLAQRQAQVVSETSDYEKRRTEAGGSLTIAQRAGVRGLGQVQAGLKEETAGLAEQLEGAPVFALTLKRAVERMDEAATRLQTLKTDEPTQAAAREAARKLQQLLDALQADDSKNGGQGGGGGGGGGGGNGGGDGIPALAQLKMLKSLQEELNERTESLEELRRRRRQLTADQVKEAARLSEDQGILADLARDLTKPRRDDGDE